MRNYLVSKLAERGWPPQLIQKAIENLSSAHPGWRGATRLYLDNILKESTYLIVHEDTGKIYDVQFRHSLASNAFDEFEDAGLENEDFIHIAITDLDGYSLNAYGERYPGDPPVQLQASSLEKLVALANRFDRQGQTKYADLIDHLLQS